MFFIARKNLFQEKTRFFISVGGVTFSIVLILILTGLYRGWKNKLGEYIKVVPADIWVMQSGSEELFHTPSILPLSVRGQLEAVDGVESVKPFNARRVAIKFNDKELNLYVVAYDKSEDIGKPARIVEGKSLPDQGEIILDKTQRKKVVIGDTLSISGQNLKVVGFAEGGDLVTSSFAFVLRDEINKIQKLPDAANFFLVKIRGNDVDRLINKIITDVPGVNAVSKKTFLENNVEIVTDSFLPVILVLLVIGVVVGIAVIGLTIFTATLEKSREYGVLKAIGTSNLKLNTMVIEQALISGVIGYIIGAIIAYLLGLIIPNYQPVFVTLFQPFDFAWIFGATLLMSVIAAYIPIHRIGKIDPAEVFKS